MLRSIARSFGLDKLFTLLARLTVKTLVRFTTVPDSASQLHIDRSKPIVYALHVRQLSALLILEDATARLGLPRPLAPLVTETIKESGSFFFLTRSGQPSPLQRNPYEYSKRLTRLVAATRNDRQADIQIVPVSIFWGRSPTKQDSIFKALLADNWAAPGIFKQLLRLIIHGRQTMLKFGEPIALNQALESNATSEPTLDKVGVRRVARLLRAEFRHERELAVGPNLSHRQTLVNEIIASKRVQDSIQLEAHNKQLSLENAEVRARKTLYEIASDYSYPVIRSLEIALSALWNRIYNGVVTHRFDTIAEAGSGAQIVYVPCHRSHVDYLLLSYLLFTRGLTPPHVAAGANLNIPLVGILLRKGGAFFLRRSFKGDQLYGTIFEEYMHTISSRGFPLKYFIEGGRSRSGRMLTPKAGLLAMTVDSFRRGLNRPLVFLPVYIGYEQLIEGDTYVAELSGKKKQRESIFGLLMTVRKLRRRFGQVHVNIGEPIRLEPFLTEHWPDWKNVSAEPEQRKAAIAQLALRIVQHINDAVVVNPVNLIATAMLGARRHAMDLNQLATLIDLLKSILEVVPYSNRQTLTPMDGQAVIAYASTHGMIERIEHPFGDVVRVPAKQAVLLAYFRNNTLHAYALPSLIAGLIALNERLSQVRLIEVVKQLFPFLRAELMMSWRDQDLQGHIDRTLQLFEVRGLISRVNGDLIAAPNSQRESVELLALAQVMRHPLERYLIVVSTLVKFGTARLSSKSLEDYCYLLAQRLSYLHEAGGPEFFDRASFRTIIHTLIEIKHVQAHDASLHFDDSLINSSNDAQLLLPDDVRIAISHLSQLSPEDIARAEKALAEPK
jgi:glycerol-3-phosphate O-acyltransferase